MKRNNQPPAAAASEGDGREGEARAAIAAVFAEAIRVAIPAAGEEEREAEESGRETGPVVGSLTKHS